MNDAAAPTVEQYLGLVAAIAVRVSEQLPVTVDLEDLKQAGAIGLIDAIAKFDVNAGVNFATYAKHRIRGAIVDSLRELDWMSRDGRRLQKRIERTKELLRGELGRDPEPEAIANALELTLDRYLEIVQQLSSRILSGDSGKHTDDGEAIAFDAPSESKWFNPVWLTEQAEAREILQQVTGNVLSARYQLVIELYYGSEALSMSEIGERMGINESRVSQIHKRALAKLAAGMRARRLDGTRALLS